MLVWIQLRSSVISAAAYQGGSLFIRFNSGHEYMYDHVQRNIYENLIRAESVGQYFNEYIKDQYAYNRIA